MPLLRVLIPLPSGAPWWLHTLIGCRLGCVESFFVRLFWRVARCSTSVRLLSTAARPSTALGRAEDFVIPTAYCVGRGEEREVQYRGGGNGGRTGPGKGARTSAGTDRQAVRQGLGDAARRAPCDADGRDPDQLHR